MIRIVTVPQSKSNFILCERAPLISLLFNALHLFGFFCSVVCVVFFFLLREKIVKTLKRYSDYTNGSAFEWKAGKTKINVLNIIHSKQRTVSFKMNIKELVLVIICSNHIHHFDELTVSTWLCQDYFRRSTETCYVRDGNSVNDATNCPTRRACNMFVII